MLQDRNTNVKVDAWIKQFNEEQKVQDQRIANLEETEKTVQNSTCFDGCTSAQWKDYIANNPATDIETDNFRVHNNTSEIKMGSNVELKSGSSKVDVDSSSVKNETQFTNQFSEVSKAKTEIYSGDDSTHFEAKAECGPEGKSSCIRVSADYSLLHTSTSNADYGNYYFSNQKAEFTFPSHCFEFCCDGRFLIDGQPSSVTNAICFDGCNGDCWRDYIADQIPAKAQDTYCFDGCDATCWKDYIDSKAGNQSRITSPDGCALVTTTCNGNQVYICDQVFTLGCTSNGFTGLKSNNNLILESGSGCNTYICAGKCIYIDSFSNDEYDEVGTYLRAFSYGEVAADIGVVIDAPSGGGGIAYMHSNTYTEISSSHANTICAQCCNLLWSVKNCICARCSSKSVENIIQASSNCGASNCLLAKINCLCASCCNNIMSSCKNCICARSSSGSVQNVISALSDSSSGQNFLNAKTSNYLQSSNYNLLQASNYNSFHASCCNEIKSGEHCWVFCCDGNLYKDGVCVL